MHVETSFSFRQDMMKSHVFRLLFPWRKGGFFVGSDLGATPSAKSFFPAGKGRTVVNMQSMLALQRRRT